MLLNLEKFLRKFFKHFKKFRVFAFKFFRGFERESGYGYAFLPRKKA